MNQLHLNIIIDMLRKPSPQDGSTIQGTNDRDWFEQWFKNPNLDIELSVAFAKTDVLELLNQPSCMEMVISKQIHEGKNTLAMAGIGATGNLLDKNFPVGDVTKEHLILVATYFKPPISDKTIDLDFTKMKGNDNIERHIGWETQYASKGAFNTVVNDYRSKPKHSNHFSTVNFNKAKIVEILTGEVEKIAFLKGYVTLIQKDVSHPLDEKQVVATTQINIEALIAVAMDINDNVVGEPVIPNSLWPVRWKKYE